MMKKIRKAAVIGSGVMGGGIAALLASAGVRTLMLDIVPPDLKGEQKRDPKARNRIVKQGLDNVLKASPALLMHPQDAERIDIGNLEDDFERLAECDWVIEVVVENLKVKQNLLQKIETVRRPGTIVTTNTSGIPLKAMSKGMSLEFRQHFLGTHFFNPVRYMRLLEIIPGADTLPELLKFVAEYGEKILGKGIVWAKDTPNFVGNRIGVQGIVKAMQLMREEGLTIPAVDAVFGPVMGRPKTAMFKTADLVGLDVLAHVARNTYEMVPDDEGRDSYVMPEFVQSMIEKNLLGKKSQSGFYKTELTPEWQKIRKVIDPDSLTYGEYEMPTYPCLEKARRSGSLPERMRSVVYGDDKLARFAWKALANNLIYAANRIPEISDTIVDIDNAMRWGFNFELGPFETWDAIGLKESVEKMERDGLEVPEKIRAMIAAGRSAFYRTDNGTVSYYDFAAEDYRELNVSPNIISLKALKGAAKVISDIPSATLVDLGDGVACLEFHTKMNALNAEILDFMAYALDHVDANGAGLVIGNQAGGMPGAFSAGADLKGILGAVKEKRFDDIEKMVHDLQTVLQRAKYAPFPVVAAPFGLTLGGGCEVCLAVDRIVGHTELYMGLVEIGVGLLPAGGGCLNLWRRTLQTIPASVTDVDLGRFFIPVFMTIAMAKVSTSAADARASGFLGARDRIVFNRDYLVGEAKKEVLKMVDEGYAPPVKRKIRVFGESAQGMIAAEIYNMHKGGFISDYDALLAKRIAFVISGGAIRANSELDEEAILTLERRTFMELLRQEKTVARIEHMLNTGKPLRN
ncbi:MAG: 3-hydroxyacyl-CoA dehydrogenase NAD-binding domain-containing protein [Desulfobacterales bacterium]|nr:3-hydroxyacyl-CoA dehydrogenase NAD-binding domain-containing protein [Desulfobacterales bacterium]